MANALHENPGVWTPSRRSLFNRQKVKDRGAAWVGETVRYGFLTIYVLVLIIPFIWLISSSFKDLGQYYSVPIEWIPRPLHPENYERAWNVVQLGRYIWNSAWLAAVQVTMTLFSSSFVAYGFARFRFRFREAIFVVLIASMMLPTQATSIPVYQFFRAIHWTNSFLPLLVPFVFGSAFSIFLLRQFFLSLPVSIDEAATIDGCGTLSVWLRIILPQAKPALVVVSLFTMLWSWNDLWGPLIYLSKQELYTIPIGLLNFVSPTNSQPNWQIAAVCITLIPTVLYYVFGQRYLERGIALADVK